MIIPLIILGIGAVLSGVLFKDFFIGKDSISFWQDSIFFINELSHEYLPVWLILITPIIVTIAIPLSYYYFINNPKILENFKSSYNKIYNFLLNKWYFDEIYEFIFVKPLKKLGDLFWKKGDEKTIDRFGPDGISKVVRYISNKAIKFQTGFIYDYAFVMLIGLSALITYLILK